MKINQRKISWNYHLIYVDESSTELQDWDWCDKNLKLYAKKLAERKFRKNRLSLIQLHCKKRLELFPARESLVSDIPAGDGKSLTFFTVYINRKDPPIDKN
jgi:hypothetical protein